MTVERESEYAQALLTTRRKSVKKNPFFAIRMLRQKYRNLSV